MNDYYVYEWIRLDTNEPFYIGKGRGKRWKETHGRTEWFNRIINKYKVVVNILHDNLDEETANGLEVWYIREYRDIIGYEMCNIQDGGEGHGLCGKNNPNYGKPRTQETKDKISRNHANVNGENNPMFGKNYRDYMTEEAKKEHDKKISKANKGKSPWKHKSKEEIAEWKKKMSNSQKGKREGKNSTNRKSVICLTTKKIFFTTKEAGRYYNCDNSSIAKCCKGKYKWAGKLPDGTPLIWKKLIWEHNKIYRIKEVL